jgi:hypothetical protein
MTEKKKGFVGVSYSVEDETLRKKDWAAKPRTTGGEKDIRPPRRDAAGGVEAA